MATDDAVVDDKSLNASLDEDIGSLYREIQARNGGDESATGEPAISGEPSNEDSTAQPAADTRARDESGKFTKAAPKAEPEQSAAPETASQPQGDDKATAPVAAAPTDALTTPDGKPLDITRPPSSWKPAAKVAYSSLPPDVQKLIGEEIYRREGDFHNGNRAIKENADFGQTIRATVEPYRLLIEAEGGTPETAIRDTLRTAALFRVGTPQDKLRAVFDIVQRYNVPLADWMAQQNGQQPQGQPAAQPGQPQAQPQQFHDPRVDELLRTREQENSRRASELAEQAAAAETQFRAAVDDKGQPKFPFVDNVEQDMVSRIPELRRQNPALSHFEVLTKAYDAAVWANPETRAVLLSQQQAQANQQGESLRKVESARRASAVNVPKRGALPASAPVGSLDDTIRETGKALGMF